MRLGSACAFLLFLSAAASARAQTEPIHGFSPDLSVAGGVGLGLDEKIDNNFLGRIRLGGLYAFEPYWVNAGLAVEAGALSSLAIGGELEANEAHGWFANLGLTYSERDYLTGHVSAGYMIFALEYQHAFTERRPREALLFTVRFPLGFWWLTRKRDEQRPKPPPPPQSPAVVSAGSTAPRSPAAPSGSGTAPPPQPASTPTAPATQPSPVADPETSERMARGQRALEEAVLAGVRADYAAQSDALRRAYAAQADPQLLLRIADAEIARGQRALAARALQQFLATTATADNAALSPDKPRAEAKLNELLPQLARLRVTYASATGGETFAIDATPEPGALLGYDVLLDPGPHTLAITRAGQAIVERSFEAKPGELVRLDL